MSFKWLENLFKESDAESLNTDIKRPNDPMGLAGPLPYMNGGNRTNKLISDLKNIKPSFMTGGEWSSYLKKLVNTEATKNRNFNINDFIPKIINISNKTQNGG